MKPINAKSVTAPIHYHIPFIVIVVLFVYYPALSAEISIIDDLDMVDSLLNIEKLSFWDIFIPRSAGGGYYRPLLGLSQYIDKQLWLMDSRMMHLENVLIHGVNSVLVYLLAFRLPECATVKKSSLVPLVAALIFALHPVLTESVNWISGRTDSMACSFILVSAIFLFRYQKDGQRLNLVFSGAALFISFFAKEVAFGYLLALPFLLFRQNRTTPRFEESSNAHSGNSPSPVILFLLFFSVAVIIVLFGGSHWFVIVLGIGYMLISLLHEARGKSFDAILKEHTLGFSLIFFAALATVTLFSAFRKIAFTSNIDRISNTLHLMYQDTGYAISIFLGAAGFYVKKFLWPLPLNFFILEIDPLYDLIGIAVFLLTIRLVMVKSTASALFIAGLCCTLPAFPFAFGTIAWTGYAERYIYVASAFWSIAATLTVGKTLSGLGIPAPVKKVSYSCLVMLLMLMAYITWQRNIVWQTNLGLMADTVKQSPRQKELRGMYMLAFIREGDLKSAREQYRIASSLRGVKYAEQYDLNMAGIAAAEGNMAEAEELLQTVLNSTRGKSVKALQFYIKFLENEIKSEKNPKQKRLIQDKVLLLYSKLYELNHDPFILYRTGQIYISRNELPKAIMAFEKANKSYPPGNIYGDNSAKIVQKLKDKTRSKSPWNLLNQPRVY